MHFKKFFKGLSLGCLAVMTSVVGIAGFYKTTLPDRFQIQCGESLAISSLFPMDARPHKSSYTVAVTHISARSSKVTQSTLMLFGAVPIKKVTSNTVERPLLVPCGNPFGIKLLTDGVMVVDLSAIGTKSPAKDCGIAEGDIIISINGKDIHSNNDVSQVIKNSGGKDCRVVLRRGGKKLTKELSPVSTDGTYRAGMWVRDSSAGIGTMTFYDPQTGAFAGLGHPVCDSDTGEVLPISEGAVGEIKLTGYIPSEHGSPGQLTGEFESRSTLGIIDKNCDEGLFGILDDAPVKGEPIPLGFRQEIKKGKAQILSTIDGGDPVAYDISIEQIDMAENAQHDLVVKVTDKRLLETTGGIVQGMSGSPIIQNGRIVGAVTHVFIDDPAMGYGIFADEMAAKLEGTQ